MPVSCTSFVTAIHEQKPKDNGTYYTHLQQVLFQDLNCIIHAVNSLDSVVAEFRTLCELAKLTDQDNKHVYIGR